MPAKIVINLSPYLKMPKYSETLRRFRNDFFPIFVPFLLPGCRISNRILDFDSANNDDFSHFAKIKFLSFSLAASTETQEANYVDEILVHIIINYCNYCNCCNHTITSKYICNGSDTYIPHNPTPNIQLHPDTDVHANGKFNTQQFQFTSPQKTQANISVQNINAWHAITTDTNNKFVCVTTINACVNIPN